MPYVGAVLMLGEWVDFSYEVNGKVYGFTMQGADTVSLRALIEALHVYEKESEEKGNCSAYRI